MYFFRELFPPEAAAQPSPPKTCVFVIFVSIAHFVVIFSKKVISPELFPPEAAAQRSPTKIWPDLFWPEFSGQIFLAGFSRPDFPWPDFSGTYLSKRCPGKYVFGTFLSTKNVFFKQNGVGTTLVLGGRARKITPLIYPLIFENFFGHETGRRESY